MEVFSYSEIISLSSDNAKNCTFVNHTKLHTICFPSLLESTFSFSFHKDMRPTTSDNCIIQGMILLSRVILFFPKVRVFCPGLAPVPEVVSVTFVVTLEVNFVDDVVLSPSLSTTRTSSSSSSSSSLNSDLEKFADLVVSSSTSDLQ